MAKRGATLLALSSLLVVAAPANAVQPHRSVHALPSSNGRGAIAFDATTFRVTQFLEHAYRYPKAGQETRNFAFDSYPGVRVGAAAAWLSGVAPTLVEYVEGTNVVHVVRIVSGVQLDEYDFAPMTLGENSSVMLLKATRLSGAGVIDAYALFNYHLGSGGPVPGTDNEQIAYNAGNDAFSEWGPSGVAFGYGSIGPSSHHGASPQNPYQSLQSAANLADNAGTGGAVTDAVAGLQSTLGDIPVGSSAWAGWYTVLAADANGDAAAGRVRAWVNGRAPDKILADETAAWTAWLTPVPNGASALEATLAKQSQVVLRTGQVSETGRGAGQILASIAPGKWNIAWVRDMAYATVALVRSGHLAEAKAALAFQMGASTGTYQQQVGAPYQISVVRYFGDGSEESDSNADGPNVEFDGFGLFLWALDEYVRASNDTASLRAWWPNVKSKVADVLVKLQEPTGLIAADSSIWEVHWNGKQRHFAFTTIAAANGLCSAARLADGLADAAAAGYRAAGSKARDALLTSLRAPDGTLAQSTEGMAAGTGWLDAAVIEAINFGLVDPSRRTARASLHAIESGLVPPSGRGFMRSDAGDWYSSQEWVFVDLRAARALDLRGDTAASQSLLSWNVAQASENYREMAELHDRVTADYAGEVPMIGFGAGAYLLSLYDRGKAVTPTCGAFADEPADPADAGADASGNPADAAANDSGPVTARPDGGAAGDGGLGDQAGGGSGGCGCSVRAVAGTEVALGGIAALGLGIVRRRRRTR